MTAPAAMRLPPLLAGSPLAGALYRLLDGDPVVVMPEGSTTLDLAELIVRAESVQPDMNMVPVFFTSTESGTLPTAARLQRAFDRCRTSQVVVHPTTDDRQERLMMYARRSGYLGGPLQLPLLVTSVRSCGDTHADLAIVEPSLGPVGRRRLLTGTSCTQVLVTGHVSAEVAAEYVYPDENPADRGFRQQYWGGMPVEVILAAAS